MRTDLLLSGKGITKSFPGVKALTNVDFDIREGEVHSFVGENGAGKSTLIKIITGVHACDSGEIIYLGKRYHPRSTSESIAGGISCIYQELSIVPLLNVAKNIYLGNIPEKGKGILDLKKMYAGAAKILRELELDVDPKTKCSELSIAQQQMVEIGRALSRNAKLIILDEPTSSITDREKDVLFKIIHSLKKKGISVIYVSHKLDEVLEISDRITVLRDGMKITTIDNAPELTKDDIISYMIGRTIDNYFNKVPAEIGQTVLKVENLTQTGVFSNISFEVKSGEVLGLFGLVGAGRSEIVETIVGAQKASGGSVWINGEPVRRNSVTASVKKGICLVPEDRKRQGAAIKLSVGENLSIVKIARDSRAGFVNEKQEKQDIAHYTDVLAIKTPSSRQLVGKLSGGNQQKVVIAKWLCMQPKVLILDEPTRGIDVGTKSEIYALISKLAAEGVAIIVVSSELPEIMGVCDRILTVHEGKISGEILPEDFTESHIMKYALGGEEDAG